MLRSLHIQNLALIREMDVDFHGGLNVLTGETGAGKSIVIGSVMASLGMQSAKSLLREGSTSYVELLFDGIGDEAVSFLRENGYETEGDSALISRKFSDGRSVCRVNGETASAAFLRSLSELLIDIHGQHEYQKLLKEEQQLALLDRYAEDKTGPLRDAMRAAYQSYQKARREAEETEIPEEERARRISFLEFQIAEIGDAQIREGEDEELEALYKKLSNARRIAEGMNEIHLRSGYGEDESAGEQIGRSLRVLEQLTAWDRDLLPYAEDLANIENLLNDFNRGVADYLSELTDDSGRLAETEERLNLLNRLKSKYGPSLADVKRSEEEFAEELARYQDHEERARQRKLALEKAEAELTSAAESLSGARRAAAESFEKEVSSQLMDLNFARSDFEVRFARASSCGENGADRVEFLLSTNPGEPLRPLKAAASGGELSRVMLGILTMFADRKGSGCLIFDEVDAGISGRTAQKVAEKLDRVSRLRQTLCITHLPQIAAMADHHYGIEKRIGESEAVTMIRPLDESESVEEIARLIGGSSITEQTSSAARELKQFSAEGKEKRREQL